MKWIVPFLFLPLATGLSQSPALEALLSIRDGAGGAKELRFGIDPGASDGIDTPLGEVELPPPPPVGVFDARFSGFNIGIALGQGSLRDYRQGDPVVGGTRVHEIRYQVGKGSWITITWHLPQGMSGILDDFLGGIVVHRVMNGHDSVTVTNPGAIPSLRMTVQYTDPSTGVREPASADQFVLYQNHPNPFNPSTTIQFSVPTPGNVTLFVYDMLGRELDKLVDGWFMVGTYSTSWNAGGFAGGTYVCRLQAGGFVATKKLILLK